MSLSRTYAPIDKNLKKMKNRGESSVMILVQYWTGPIRNIKKASLIRLPTGVAPYFNPEVRDEIPNEVNNRGRV
jgi:hypothetical protein